MTLPAVDWIKCRAEYEAGETYAVLGIRYGRTKSAISKRGRIEGWVQDAEPAIRRQLSERRAGISKVAAGNPEARETAIAKQVDARFEVLKRHQEELVAVRSMTYDAMKKARSPDHSVRSDAQNSMRVAKMAAETLAIIQATERRAHNLTNDPPTDPASKRVTLVLAADPYAEPDEA